MNRQYLRGQDGTLSSITTNRTSTLGSPCFPTATIAHDNAGRVLQDERSTYSWDAQDRLLRRQRLDTGEIERHAYDASGYRASTESSTGERTVEFRGPDGELWRSFRVSSAPGTIALDRDSIRLGSRVVAVVEHPGAAVVWHHADHLGSTRATTLADGTRRDRFEYSPFGLDLPDAGGALPGADRDFATHERDGDGTLDYMMARWMSPTAGRMLTVDELFDVDLDQPSTWNGYPYCRSNGLSLFDPDGMAVRGKAIAWVVRLLRERKVFVRAVDSEKEAASLVNQGRDLMAANRDTAARIGRAADGGRSKPVRDKAHPDRRGSTKGRDPHYHVGGRPRGRGHIFWSAIAGVTASHWTEGRGPVAEAAGLAIDLVNPLAVFQDTVEITQALTDPELLVPVEPIDGERTEGSDGDQASECPAPIVQEPTGQ